MIAVHGGPDARGAARHDFSTNGNAVGPCPYALEALARADASRYPDPAYTALCERLAAFHDVAPDRIVPAASASEFIFRITALVAREQPCATVCVPRHGYGDYARAAAVWGLASAPDPASARLAWACDPSSPLGEAAPPLPAGASDRVAVLDLAYEPLRLQGALALTSARRDAVWQLWTPNKALGCTGIRAAYAIAPRHDGVRAAQLRALAPSWVLGAHGVALLQAWTDPPTQAWLAASLATLRGWKARQQALCESLGWRVHPAVASFFCADPAIPDLAPALAQLRLHDIQLRDTTSFGLPGQVRLGVLPPASQDALAAAWGMITSTSSP